MYISTQFVLLDMQDIANCDLFLPLWIGHNLILRYHLPIPKTYYVMFLSEYDKLFGRKDCQKLAQY